MGAGGTCFAGCFCASVSVFEQKICLPILLTHGQGDYIGRVRRVAEGPIGRGDRIIVEWKIRGADAFTVNRSLTDRDEVLVSIYLASGSHCKRGARLHRAWNAHAAGRSETLLYGADVPTRAPAKGKISAVLSDWRGSVWGSRMHRALTRN